MKFVIGFVVGLLILPVAGFFISDWVWRLSRQAIR